MRQVTRLLTNVALCPRCGQAHKDLAIRLCPTDGPGKLRGGETHQATCPVTNWEIFFRVGRAPKTGHTFRLVVDEIM